MDPERPTGDVPAPTDPPASAPLGPPGSAWARTARLDLHPTVLAAVFCGGATGTGVRAWLGGILPSPAGTWPWTTWWINLTGSLILGALLETLARGGPDEGRRRLVRLAGGTGVLGGYTTYSAFAVEAVELVRGGHGGTGVAYAVCAVVAGVAAAALGIALASHVARRRRRRPGHPGSPSATGPGTPPDRGPESPPDRGPNSPSTPGGGL